MLRRLRTFLSIAPPATPFQDFTYHWKQLMNFYLSHLNDCKVPVHSTGIPRHLERLLEILLEEEKDVDEPGPCMEYLLRHKLLDLLATLAIAETPPGMRAVCLAFLRKLIGRSRHPLLHHASVYGPIHRLIALCNGTPPSPHEAEEVRFLLVLCFLVCKYPHVTSIVNDAPTVRRNSRSVAPRPPRSPTGTGSERIEVEKVTYVPARRRNSSNPLFEPLDTRAVTLVNPNLFAGEKERRRSVCSDRSGCSNRPLAKLDSSVRSNGSVSSRDTDGASRSPSPSGQRADRASASAMLVSGAESGLDSRLDSRLDAPYETTDDLESATNVVEAHLQSLGDPRFDSQREYVYEDSDGPSKRDDPPRTSEMPRKSECLLLDALISYANSADNTVRIRACEGIMVLASLDEPPFAQTVASSELPLVMANRLENLFNAIPAHVDPSEIDAVNVTWALDSPQWTSEKKFSGCRQVAAFFMWYDYCNQLIREAQPEVAAAVANAIRVTFFDKVLTPALADHHVVLVTALITKCLKELASSALSNEVSKWLVGEHRDPEIPNVCASPVLHRLVENCSTDSDDLTIETLKLFEEMIDKRDEHILHCLLLMYLSSRGYYDSTAADSGIASWSDEEDEREREKKGTLDLSYRQSRSRTLAPSNIHRIINCFLSLVPRALQTDSDVGNYERYMADWERQYLAVLAECSLMAWPLEAVTLDDSASSDSRPEADHCTGRFYPGPFLAMLFDRVGNIPKQKYEINLQLTVVISRLALLPHPYLHEFLLNPLLPLAPGTKSLFVCLQKVVKQIMYEVPKIPSYKETLKETRQRLLGDNSHGDEKENVLFESVVITEEFCKELAAIAYVKYHRSM